MTGDSFHIAELPPGRPDLVRATAELLFAAFAEHFPGYWSDVDATLTAVQRSLQADRLHCAALSDREEVMGFVAAVPEYQGHTWVLYDLGVHPDWQRRGVGRALVTALEEKVRDQGGTTLYLGTDDLVESTSLGGRDLYPDVLEHVGHIRNLRRHPFEFYKKLGFTIVGIVPDANGFGKPDILMAKRVATIDASDGQEYAGHG